MRHKEDYNKYYEKIEKIGEGGFGTVYSAKLKNTGELRAIKIIDINKIIDEFLNENLINPTEEEIKTYIDGLYNEIENMKILEGKDKNNINSVKFYEYFHTEKEFCIVMELCDENLFQILSKKEVNKGFDIDEIKNILNQLNNSFKIMFENNIIHRDLKLQNFLVKYKNKEKTDYIVKLTDYGISKHLLSLSKKLSIKIGTMNMMAPEILKGEKYNEKCDLWSLGIIIYILYLHKYPYILNQIQKNNKIILKNIDNSVLKDLVNKLLQLNPSKRITWNDYFNHSFFQIHKNNEKEKTVIENKLLTNNFLEKNHLTNEKDEKEKSVDTKKEECNLSLFKKDIKQENEPETLKAVLLGDCSKTFIINQLTTHKFDPQRETSLSAQFISKIIYFDDINRSLKFDLWDTVGQEKYRSLAKIFYKEAQVIIFVYDITSSYTFEAIKNYWYPEVKANCDREPILAVAANNIHLYEEQQVSNSDGKAFADEIGAIFQTITPISDIGISTLIDNIGKTYLIPGYNYQELDKKAEE